MRKQLWLPAAVILASILGHSQAQDNAITGYWTGTLQVDKERPDRLEIQIEPDGKSGKIQITDAGTKEIISGALQVKHNGSTLTITYSASSEDRRHRDLAISGSFTGEWSGGNVWDGKTAQKIASRQSSGQFHLQRSEGTAKLEPPKIENEDQLKKKLFNRYDGRIVVPIVSGLSAGQHVKSEIGLGPGVETMTWYHFPPNEPLPQEGILTGWHFSEWEKLDDRTFGKLKKGLTVSPVAKYEPLKVDKFYVGNHGGFLNVQLVLIATKLSHFNDLDPNRANTNTTISRDETTGGTNVQTKLGNIGFVFTFVFDKMLLKAGKYDAIVGEINRYVLPEDEAKTVAKAATTIEIDVGIAEDDLVKKLGEPLKTIKVGKLKYLKYKDMTITIEDGKVSNIKIE